MCHTRAINGGFLYEKNSFYDHVTWFLSQAFNLLFDCVSLESKKNAFLLWSSTRCTHVTTNSKLIAQNVVLFCLLYWRDGTLVESRGQSFVYCVCIFWQVWVCFFEVCIYGAWGSFSKCFNLIDSTMTSLRMFFGASYIGFGGVL